MSFSVHTPVYMIQFFFSGHDKSISEHVPVRYFSGVK